LKKIRSFSIFLGIPRVFRKNKELYGFSGISVILQEFQDFLGILSVEKI
jgi:hypothetical protein